jgi:hypothetical protein
LFDLHLCPTCLAAAGSTSAAASSSLTAGLSALSNPFKIRLSRAAEEGSGLKDYSPNMVLIEPLASMSQIEDFLWPRVMGGGASAATAAAAGGAGADDPRSRQAAAAAAATAAAAGRPEASVNAAAARASAAAAAAATEAAAAAAAAAAGGSRPGSGGGGRRGRQAASEKQPIPQRRLTRAQARLAAEAEVLGQGTAAAEEQEEQAGDPAAEARRQLAAVAAAEAAVAALAAAEREALMEEEMLVGGADGEEGERVVIWVAACACQLCQSPACPRGSRCWHHCYLPLVGGPPPVLSCPEASDPPQSCCPALPALQSMMRMRRWRGIMWRERMKSTMKRVSEAQRLSYPYCCCL